MPVPICSCEYNSKIYLIVDLARMSGVPPEVLRGRFKAAKSSVVHNGRTIPVLTDFDLRPVGATSANFGAPKITELNREWLSKPLIRRVENV